MEGKANRVPVLIVGAGPVGLSLALELGLRRIKCVVVDERDGKVNLPKMNTVNTRTMEFCRRWGVATQVRNSGIGENHPLDVRFITSMAGHELLRLTYPSYNERGRLDYTPEGNCVCSQLWFDPILLKRVQSLPDVTLSLMTRVDSFVQESAGIQAKVTDLKSGHQESLSSVYLVGCDGAESLVRQIAGIKLVGNPRLNSNLNVFFKCPKFVTLQNGRLAQMHRIVGPEGIWGNMHALDGRGLWRMTVHLQGESRPDVQQIINRVAGCETEFEVLGVYTWDRRTMVAQQYRQGNIFLAGDSAHQMSTTGGFGMNTGIADAVDLAWKLEAAIKGWAGPHLLESYEAERKQVAEGNLESTTKMFWQSEAMRPGKAIDEDSLEGEQSRAAFVEGLLASDVRRQFEVEGAALGYRYDPSPIVWPDGTPPPIDDCCAYIQTARPGSRAPHVWLDDARSTLDLFRFDFTLLRFGKTPVRIDPLVEAAAQLRVPLTVVDIEDGRAAELFERRLVLVRPDGHTAWRSDACPKKATEVVDCVRGALMD